MDIILAISIPGFRCVRTEIYQSLRIILNWIHWVGTLLLYFLGKIIKFDRLYVYMYFFADECVYTYFCQWLDSGEQLLKISTKTFFYDSLPGYHLKGNINQLWVIPRQIDYYLRMTSEILLNLKYDIVHVNLDGV